MKMDYRWKKFYDERANKDLPEFQKGFWTRQGYEQLLRITIELVKDLQLKKNSRVLDVGCGVGRYCSEISKLGLDVLGVDNSEPLIDEAKVRYPSLNFNVSNGYSLNFDDKSFDLVFSIGVLQCIESHDIFLDEICRVSKRFVIISTLLNQKKIDLQAELAKLLADDPAPTRDYHPEHITDILEKHGFRCRVILHENDKLIRDGFFVVAERSN